MEELITLETAKLAKSKGFDWKVKHYFTLLYTGNGFGNGYNYNAEPNQASRPTQAVLQRWLREVHQIHIVVDHYKKGNYSARLADAGDNSLSIELFGEVFETYELALEAALKESLNQLQ